MRFLMLNWRDPHNPLSGGAERVTLGYLSALAERGHEVSWYAYAFPGSRPEDELKGVQIVRGGGVGSAIVQARRWYRRQPRFALVIDQHHGIPWFAPWWCQTNCIAYIHEVLGPIWGAFYRWPMNRIGPAQERWTHRLYARVPFWTACPSTQQALEGVGVRNVTLIPYGVHTVALPAMDSKPLTPPLELAVVSRLAPNKRVDHAILALHNLGRQGVPARLTIIGSGVVEQQLKALTAGLGLSERVVFTGPLSEQEKDEQLRRSHLLLHTSMREGWGLNVIEANAMGTPAVVYPVAGLVESTLHDRTGRVSAAETPESLAAEIRMLVANPERYQFYRQQAWERAKTFHWDQVLPKACDWLEAQASRA
jgi:glycosyltransferase involved in cell wall biosynthesis